MFDWITSPDAWVAFATLVSLEVVLGIDNIIFISILAGKLPLAQQAQARNLGLLLAAGVRIALLFSISWIIQLKDPLFEFIGRSFTGKDLILIAGGLFLIYKATKEIHEKLEGEDHAGVTSAAPIFGAVIAQILLVDIVFSLDSVITAVGMTDQIGIMVAAVLFTVVVMLIAAKPISEFVNRHPTVKMLALSFLLLIGTTLIAEGLGFKIPKGYIYFAMAFSVLVEMLNLASKRKKGKTVQFNDPQHRIGSEELARAEELNRPRAS